MGILLLRMSLAVGLIADSIGRLLTPDVLQRLIAVVQLPAGVLLLMGLYTTVVASLICLLQLASLPLSYGSAELHLLRVTVAFGLSLIGPGAWSLDARLFGRRRVEIQNLQDN